MPEVRGRANSFSRSPEDFGFYAGASHMVRLARVRVKGPSVAHYFSFFYFLFLLRNRSRIPTLRSYFFFLLCLKIRAQGFCFPQFARVSSFLFCLFTTTSIQWTIISPSHRLILKWISFTRFKTLNILRVIPRYRILRKFFCMWRRSKVA